MTYRGKKGYPIILRIFLSVVFIVCIFACVPHACAAQNAGVNEAIVDIDGELMLFKAVSMQTVEAEYESSVTMFGDFWSGYKAYFSKANGQIDYFLFKSEVQVDIIEFEAVDQRSNKVIRRLVLCLPGNWESGKTYVADAEDRLYGYPVVYYKNLQTDFTGTSALKPKEGIFVFTDAYASLIIDDASDDYSMVKGRFKVTYVAGSGGVDYRGVFEIGVSEFYVDKNSLPKTNSVSDFPDF